MIWQGPGNPQFIVERSTDGINFAQVAEVTQASYTETAPLWGTTYYYRVAQKGQDGAVSAFSDPVQVTTDPVPVPTELVASLEGNNVKLTWQAVQGVEGYVIEKSTDNETWQILANVTTTSYTDQATAPNTRYFYRVRSDGGNSQFSEPSNTVEITVNISEMPTPGAGTMARDVLEYGSAVVVSTGGLLALGLALKGSGWLMAVIRMFLR
ncbi:MAG: hypothetical protein QHH75_11875 [Bacillota bacterium]|nr:hypothetical protein [Bacillota bacterium]